MSWKWQLRINSTFIHHVVMLRPHSSPNSPNDGSTDDWLYENKSPWSKLVQFRGLEHIFRLKCECDCVNLRCGWLLRRTVWCFSFTLRAAVFKNWIQRSDITGELLFIAFTGIYICIVDYTVSQLKTLAWSIIWSNYVLFLHLLLSAGQHQRIAVCKRCEVVFMLLESVWACRLLPAHFSGDTGGGEGPRGEHTPTAYVRVFQNRGQHLVILRESRTHTRFSADVHSNLWTIGDICRFSADTEDHNLRYFILTRRNCASWPQDTFTHPHWDNASIFLGQKVLRQTKAKLQWTGMSEWWVETIFIYCMDYESIFTKLRKLLETTCFLKRGCDFFN